MVRDITQRELRNSSGDIMRALDRGESFVVTRNGIPVGELVPIRRQRFVSRDVVKTVFADAAEVDASGLRRDLDDEITQDATPRA